MKDDAVSPVIAAMLLLALIVTFLSAWNAILLPSLKEESEISHMREVESGFLRFSSDISTAASLKTNLHFSERILLGGGDVLFNSLRSGGMLRIQKEPGAYISMNLTNSSGEVPESVHDLFLSNISYRPVENFWQDQGYIWKYGYTNVTNGEVQTPLEYNTMDNVEYPLAASLFSVGTIPSSEDGTKCSVIMVKSVNLTPEEDRIMVSGNGMATLFLTSSVSTGTFTNITGFTMQFYGPAEFRHTLNESASGIFGQNLNSCSNIQVQYPGDDQIGLVFDSFPNMTVRREITEIALAVS